MRTSLSLFSISWPGVAGAALQRCSPPPVLPGLGHRQFAVDQANPLRQPGGALFSPSRRVLYNAVSDSISSGIYSVRQGRPAVYYSLPPAARRGCQRRVQPRHCFLDVGFVLVRLSCASGWPCSTISPTLRRDDTEFRLPATAPPVRARRFYRAAAGGDFIKLEVPRPARKQSSITAVTRTASAERGKRVQSGHGCIAVVRSCGRPLILSCNTTRRAVGSLCSRKMASSRHPSQSAPDPSR